jgi:hypothetical protein
MRRMYVQTLLLLLPLAVMAGCGAGSSAGLGSQSQSASIFTVATDASLPSVVSCQLTVNGLTLANGSTNVSVLSAPVLVDFAKLNGLHDLIDLNTVPTGTYTSATLTLGTTASIGYINTATTPPSIGTQTGTLSQTVVTVPLAKPFVLNAADLVGLRMEFDIRQSLATDGSGQITGVVNPTFHMQLLNATDANVSIDDFRGGYVGKIDNNTFTIQGPHGRQWTVSTNNNTDFDTGDQPNSFTTNTIVEVSGTLNPVSKTIDASEVEVVSDNKFLVEGLLTSVRPPAGQPATAADLYVRVELPDLTGVPLGSITTFSLDGSEMYRIGNLRFPVITSVLFNNSSMTPGQAVTVGGTISTSAGINTLTPKRIVLGRQGQSGAWDPGSTNITAGNVGNFTITDTSTAGVLLPSHLTVLSMSETRYINLSGLSALSGSQAIPIRVVGFILASPSTHQPVMVARFVEKMTP